MSDITAEQVKQSMLDKNITHVDHRECGGCKHMVYYSRVFDRLYFNPGCSCSGYNSKEPREWEEAARWINMQSQDEIRVKIATRFGLEQDVEAP